MKSTKVDLQHRKLSSLARLPQFAPASGVVVVVRRTQAEPPIAGPSYVEWNWFG